MPNKLFLHDSSTLFPSSYPMFQHVNDFDNTSTYTTKALNINTLHP